MKKRFKCISIILTCLLLSACDTITNTDLEEKSNSSESITQDTSIDTQSSAENITTTDESIIVTTQTITSDTSTSISDNTFNTTLNDDTSTTISDITNDITETTTTSISDNGITSSDINVTSINNADFVIPIQSDSEYITEDICRNVAEYFNAMKNIDTQTFLDKQLPEYNSFMDNYLQENSSSTKDMLETYYQNILKSSDPTNDTTPYSSVDFNSIELVYPNDFDSIMNTMNYINQLDDITLEYGQYTLSDELSAYYELQYTIDYTLHGDGVEDYNSTNSGKILVLVIENQIYLIMLS